METLSYTRQIFSGKTVGRILFNRAVAAHAHSLSGKVLDLACGGSYERLLPDGIELVRTNITQGEGADTVDFNRPLPFADAVFEHVFLFNALYIAEEPLALLREMRRVLARSGTALVASPFLANEMPEPHDYARFTREGLERLFLTVGFSNVQIEPYGERFTVAANLLHPFWVFNSVRWVVYALALGLDRLIPAKLRTRHPAPIGYFCILTK